MSGAEKVNHYAVCEHNIRRPKLLLNNDFILVERTST